MNDEPREWKTHVYSPPGICGVGFVINVLLTVTTAIILLY